MKCLMFIIYTMKLFNYYHCIDGKQNGKLFGIALKKN